MKIAVIGAGIGGLAAAIRLSVKGHEVTVFEKNNVAGGKLSELKMGEFRFDTGPSLFTLPNLVEELFEMCGEKMEALLPYQRIENNCKYFFSDGTIFNFFHEKEKLKNEITEKTTENAEAIFNRLSKSEEVYNASAPVFLFSSFHKLSNFNTAPYKKMLCKVHKLNFSKTMHSANNKDFSDKNMVQLFDRYATYNGSNPYQAPATLNMIAHLENNIGAFFPEKGMYAIVDSLYELAKSQGVTFKFNSLVNEIIVKENIAEGIKVDDKTELFDLIVSDSDTKYLADNMLKHPLKKRLQKAEPSSSALIFYWGINRQFADLELHNILFSNDYKTEFEKLFKEKTLTDDPTVYLFVSSKMVKSDAPNGSENWFVMINAPSNNGQDWESLVSEARKNIILKINNTFKIDIEQHIVCQQIASPLTIERSTLSEDGALYGSSSNSIFSAFLRHPNWLKNIKNLYFVGGSVHPGGGIPLCLASAQIIDQEIPKAHE
ncbi:MAG: 1-hydroxycarotenoid 3,4-desaturase CrtD [Paludibacter sp.]